MLGLPDKEGWDTQQWREEKRDGRMEDLLWSGPRAEQLPMWSGGMAHSYRPAPNPPPNPVRQGLHLKSGKLTVRRQ